MTLVSLRTLTLFLVDQSELLGVVAETELVPGFVALPDFVRVMAPSLSASLVQIQYSTVTVTLASETVGTGILRSIPVRNLFGEPLAAPQVTDLLSLQPAASCGAES